MTLEFKNLSVSYGRSQILNGVSDRWEQGQITALIGCNGAGKSTLLQALAGLITTDGALSLDGQGLDSRARRKRVAYMPQDTSAQSSLSVLEVVLLGRLGQLGLRLPPDLVAEAMAALDSFGLAGLHARNLDQISGGQRQMVFLAQALFGKPDVLLLDEPTAALDLRHQLVVLERLRQVAQQQRTVIGLAMHDLNLAAQYADRMLGLSRGQVVQAGPASVVLTPQNLAEMYGIEAQIRQTETGDLQVRPIRAAGPIRMTAA